MTYGQVEYKAPARRIPLKWVAVAFIILLAVVLLIFAPGAIIGPLAWVGNGLFGAFGWFGTLSAWIGFGIGFAIALIVALVAARRSYFFKQKGTMILPQQQNYIPQSTLSTSIPTTNPIPATVTPIPATVTPTTPPPVAPIEQKKPEQ